MIKERKITVVGAGFVGASVTYTLAMRNLAHQIVLIDINKEKAEGEAVDISHCAPIFGSIDLKSGDYSDVKDSDIIILTAGVGRKPGETRMDLANKNVSIMKSIIDEIMKYYNGGIFVIVSNPVDVMTAMVTKWTGLPANKVIGSGTSLDSIRLCQTLYPMYDVDVKDIDAYMIGEHGETQFPFWSKANIGNVPISEYPKKDGTFLTEEEMAEIAQSVKASGSYIIKNKGATYFGVASATSEIANAILNSTKQILPVSMLKDDVYGFKNVAVSMPRIVSGEGIVGEIPVKLSEKEEELMKKSAENVYTITKEFF